jgi:hypothetical protein
MKVPIVRCSGAWLVLAVAALCWSGAATPVAAQCATFPAGYVPFTQIYKSYPVSPGSLVVGAMTLASYSQLSSVPLPSAIGQTFCAPIQLAPNSWVIAYVPTAEERFGDFSYYLSVSPYTQLFDPVSGAPFLNNQIPPSRLPGALPGVFAWHILGPAPGPSATTQAIISRVNFLYSQGALNSGQDNSLVKELQKAFDMISAGKISGAVGNLQSFITEVQDLESSGVLTTSQATTLIYEADIVIAELSEL